MTTPRWPSFAVRFRIAMSRSRTPRRESDRQSCRATTAFCAWAPFLARLVALERGLDLSDGIGLVLVVAVGHRYQRRFEKAGRGRRSKTVSCIRCGAIGIERRCVTLSLLICFMLCPVQEAIFSVARHECGPTTIHIPQARHHQGSVLYTRRVEGLWSGRRRHHSPARGWRICSEISHVARICPSAVASGAPWGAVTVGRAD